MNLLQIILDSFCITVRAYNTKGYKTDSLSQLFNDRWGRTLGEPINLAQQFSWYHDPNYSCFGPNPCEAMELTVVLKHPDGSVAFTYTLGYQ